MFKFFRSSFLVVSALTLLSACGSNPVIYQGEVGVVYNYQQLCDFSKHAEDVSRVNIEGYSKKIREVEPLIIYEDVVTADTNETVSLEKDISFRNDNGDKRIIDFMKQYFEISVNFRGEYSCDSLEKENKDK